LVPAAVVRELPMYHFPAHIADSVLARITCSLPPACLRSVLVYRGGGEHMLPSAHCQLNVEQAVFPPQYQVVGMP